MKRSPFSLTTVLCASLLLGACSAFAPPVEMPPLTPPTMDAAPAWQAPPPPAGGQAALRDWWQQFQDPLLLELIDASQTASPSVAAAASRVEQARAASVAAGALLLPTLDANAAASTGRGDVGGKVASFATANLQASWQLDLFGANQAARNAAVARLEGTQAGWYEVRITVAAEVASTYNALRSCEALVLQTAADTRSRGETARITELGAKAGLFAPANAALARASAAQGRSLLAG